MKHTEVIFILMSLVLRLLSKSNTIQYRTFEDADILAGQARKFYSLGNLEAARKAYNQAKGLYRQVQDRSGEASVIQSLESLESE